MGEKKDKSTHTHTYTQKNASTACVVSSMGSMLCRSTVSSFAVACPVLSCTKTLSLSFAFPDLKFYVSSYSTRLEITAMPSIAVVVMVLLLSLCLNSYSYSINYPKPNFPISNLIFFFCLCSFLPFYLIRR